MALTQISTAGVKDDAVTSGKIPANAVGSSELADNAVTAAKIGSEAVTNAKIQTNAVDDRALASNSVVTGVINNGAVTAAKIGDEQVTLSKLPHGTSSNDGKFLRANNGADPSFETVSSVGGATGVDFNDSVKARFGTGNDLQLFHDGTTSRIDDLTGSDIEIRAQDIRLQTNADVGAKSAINCNANAAVEILHNDVKQLETHESGIILPKAVIRGMGGSKAMLGGTIDPSSNKTWNFSFNTNAHGTNNGYVFNVKFYMNHWNSGDYYKYIEFIWCGRGNTTSAQRLDLINNLGASGSWANSYINAATVLSGGTMNGSSSHKLEIQYIANGAPSYTSGYYLEVNHSAQIGQVTIT